MTETIKTLYKDATYCQRCPTALELKKDAEGKIRAICPACGFVLYRNPLPAVAILALDEAGRLLLVKRLCEPAAGEWALPSGYMEITHSPEDNALAELHEETGLIGEIDHCIGWFYGFSPIYYRVLSIGFRVKVTGGRLQAGDDAEAAEFFALDQLPHIAFAAHRHFIQLETGINAQ